MIEMKISDFIKAGRTEFVLLKAPVGWVFDKSDIDSCADDVFHLRIKVKARR